MESCLRNRQGFYLKIEAREVVALVSIFSSALAYVTDSGLTTRPKPSGCCKLDVTRRYNRPSEVFVERLQHRVVHKYDWYKYNHLYINGWGDHFEFDTINLSESESHRSLGHNSLDN